MTRPRRKAVLWVVEMWNWKYDRFEPTLGTDLLKADARCVMLGWRRRCPDDKFRLARYERVEPKE